MFIIYSLIWMACDAIFMKPIFILFTHLGWFRNEETRLGMAEVTIGTTLGVIAGSIGFPMIAFAFTTRIWSWLATAALIFTSWTIALSK